MRDIEIVDSLKFQNPATGKIIPVVVENDAAAAAMYEAQVRLSKNNDALLNDFVLIRSGKGIGVGLVLE